MIRVGNSKLEGVTENGHGFHKADAMFGKVDFFFLRIPFKLHKLKSTTTEKAVNILKVRREVLEQGAQLLLQKETLVEEDLKALKGALPAVA